MFELLAVASNAQASDWLTRTSDAGQVQEIVRLSLTPAFLLAAIGALMNVIMARLIWIAGRIERLTLQNSEQDSSVEAEELKWLWRRRHLAQLAVMCSTAAALTICLEIALLFVSALIAPTLGTITAIVWIAAMIALVTGLILFFAETMVAAMGHREKAMQRKTDQDE